MYEYKYAFVCLAPLMCIYILRSQIEAPPSCLYLNQNGFPSEILLCAPKPNLSPLPVSDW